MNVKTAKARLRNTMKEKRGTMSDAERDVQSQAVCRLLREFWHEHAGNSAAVYLATPAEVNIDAFIAELLHSSVAVWAPMGNGFARLNSLEDVCVGRWGSREPVLECGEQLPHDTLFFVPGFAFDLNGNRLGHGAGWYDRALVGYPKAMKIGVAFDFQLVAELSCEEHDVALDGLVTPGGIRLG